MHYISNASSIPLFNVLHVFDCIKIIYYECWNKRIELNWKDCTFSGRLLMWIDFTVTNGHQEGSGWVRHLLEITPGIGGGVSICDGITFYRSKHAVHVHRTHFGCYNGGLSDLSGSPIVDTAQFVWESRVDVLSSCVGHWSSHSSDSRWSS